MRTERVAVFIARIFFISVLSPQSSLLSPEECLSLRPCALRQFVTLYPTLNPNLEPATRNGHPYSPSNTFQKSGNDFATQFSSRINVPGAASPATANSWRFGGLRRFQYHVSIALKEVPETVIPSGSAVISQPIALPANLRITCLA